MNRTAALLLAPALLIVTPAVSGTQPGQPAISTGAINRLTLDLDGVLLRRSLELVTMGSGLKYEVAPEVPDVPITLSLKDVPVRAAVRRIVAVAATRTPGLMIDRESEPHVIRISSEGSSARLFRGPRTKVTVATWQKPLRSALDQLFEEMDSWVVVDANVPDPVITTRFEGVSLDSAVWLLAGAASAQGPKLQVHRTGGNYRVALADTKVAGSRLSSSGSKTAKNRKINLRLRYVPLRRAVKTVTADQRYRVLVESGVPNRKVTMTMRNLGPEEALRQITRVAGLREPRVTYARAGDVFVVFMGPGLRNL